jgi:hypothetical protein
MAPQSASFFTVVVLFCQMCPSWFPQALGSVVGKDMIGKGKTEHGKWKEHRNKGVWNGVGGGSLCERTRGARNLSFVTRVWQTTRRRMVKVVAIRCSAKKLTDRAMFGVHRLGWADRRVSGLVHQLRPFGASGLDQTSSIGDLGWKGVILPG